MWRLASRKLRPAFHNPKADEFIVKYVLIPGLFVMTALILVGFLARLDWKELPAGLMQMMGTCIVVVIVTLGVVINHFFFKKRPPETRPYRGRHRV